MHTTHTSKSQSRGKSHISHEENARNMQRRLIILREACAMNGKSELHPILTSFLMVRKVATIGANRGLPLASLSHMMRTIIMNIETEIHPWWAWETTP